MRKAPDMGFQDQTPSSRPAFRARDSSPDSVIYALESSFSLFSSASASVERCSFASEAHDRDSLISEISLVNLISLLFSSCIDSNGVGYFLVCFCGVFVFLTDIED